MKRFVVCLVGGLAFTVAVASAQGPPPAGLADMLRQNYNGLKGNIIGSAEKMPEADFASKPSSMPEVRTFAQLFGHIANAQYNQCAGARGVANPSQGVNLEEKTSKADVTKFLADVFAFCDPAFQSLTDQSALELVAQGPRQVARGGILAGLLSHSNEMYGTAAAYLRAKNLVPPSTENQGRRGGGPGGPGRGGRGQ